MDSPHRLRTVASLISGYGTFGLLWGLALRGWMRLISTDPEFTLSGTLFIVGLCACVCMLSGLSRATAVLGVRRIFAVPLHVLAGVATLLLGLGPGALLLPALVGGGMARAFVTDRTARRLAMGSSIAASVVLATLTQAELATGRRAMSAALLALLLALMTTVYATAYRPSPRRSAVPLIPNHLLPERLTPHEAH
jgi:hypothetical protein